MASPANGYGRPFRLLVASLFILFWSFVILLDIVRLGVDVPLWFYALGTTVLSFVLGMQGKATVTTPAPADQAAPQPAQAPVQQPTSDQPGLNAVSRMLGFVSQQGLAMVMAVVLLVILIWVLYQSNQRDAQTAAVVVEMSQRLDRMETSMAHMEAQLTHVDSLVSLHITGAIPPVPTALPTPTTRP